MSSVTDPVLQRLFRSRTPCLHGKELLQVFAMARPSDFSFLQAADLSHPGNQAFAGIPEWDAFAEHYASCKRCNA